MLAVSYMGTKRHLAPIVADLVADSRPGALLDLFSGMCAVGHAVAPSRQIWCNDLQHFAHLVASCQFCSKSDPPDSKYVECRLSSLFRYFFEDRENEEYDLVDAESSALDTKNVADLAKFFEDGIFRANRLSAGGGAPYSLFLDRYAGSYFGVRQAIEIDAIRRAIDGAIDDPGVRDWLLVGLCSALGRCANTTGHFAQALYPKFSNIEKVINQRRRSIWSEFLSAFDRMQVLGSYHWRSGNRVFNREASSLLSDIENGSDVGVVYADPPYTADQYSRYYHLYETAILYDYPIASGRGLYRDGRAVSKFCHSRKIRSGIERLVARTSKTGADLILSYPSSGLLPNSRSQITAMISEYFGRPPEIFSILHSHSTMGASKGQAKRQVTELLYRARR
jgi:adenine-specific DNA-methyltransferase